MKITTNKYGEVSIRWEYDKSDNPVITKAFLEKGSGKEKAILSQVVIKRRYKDKHNKELARRYSLGKLIQNSFSREELKDRVVVWDAYKERIPKK